MLEDVVSFCAIGQCIICAVPSATQRPCFVYRCNTKVVESGQIIPLATWIPYPVMLLNELPHDMLLQIVSHLEIAELADLACTSSAFHALVLKHGYPRFLIGLDAVTIPSVQRDRCSLRKIRHAYYVEKHYADTRCLAISCTPPLLKTLPALRLLRQKSALLVTAGSALRIVPFSNSGDALPSTMSQGLGMHRLDDITSISPEHKDGSLIISHVSGLVHRIQIQVDSRGCSFKSVSRFDQPKGTVQSIDLKGNALASVAQVHNKGLISLYNAASLWQTSSTVSLPCKLWSCLLEPTSIPRWCAVGHSSKRTDSALSLFTINQTSLDAAPRSLGGNEYTTAVYALCSPHSSSNMNSSDHLFGAFYDSQVRLYDLRLADEGGKLHPTQTMGERWNEDPLYSMATAGQCGNYLAVGTARHSKIRLYDLRKHVEAVSIFATGEASPVYSLDAEHSRIFAASDKQAYMLDFGALQNRQKIKQSSTSLPCHPRFYHHSESLVLKQHVM